MKTLTALVLLVAFQMGAQSLTEKDLLGKWQISSMEVSGMVIDYDKKDIILPEAMKSVMSAEDIENMKKDAFDKIESKGFYGLEFTTGSTVAFVDGEKRNESAYTLSDKDGTQFMEGGPIPAPAAITIADGRLKLMYETGTSMTMTFKKTK